MSEATETRKIEQPSWLELPEEEKVRHTYWRCMGKDAPPKRRWFRKSERVPLWRSIFHSKEEAEAHASRANSAWIWDGDPAIPVTLHEAMSKVRRKGDRGVRVVGWSGGRFVTLKTYLPGEPLQDGRA